MSNFYMNDAIRKKIHMYLDQQLPQKERVKLEILAQTYPEVKTEIEQTEHMKELVKVAVKRQEVSPRCKACIEQIWIVQP